ncbi:site-specific DNA-methyltransferase [Patescibacteria group bacterium]|nr:site-specific DNA-methyltransferase [Patescibacteria group bacterium]
MKELEFNKIYNMDCIEGMKHIPSNTIDLVITDPPFAIEFKAKKSNYNRTQSRVLEGYNEISQEKYYEFTLEWMKEAYRVLKESGSMYVFSGWNNLKDILTAIDELGFITINHIIWKYQFGVVTKRKFVSSHYHCLYVCKNNENRKFFPYSRYDKESKGERGKSLHYEDKEDVWVIKREYWNGDQKTPTKLPAELIKKILMYSSEEGNIILDPFLGSGQVAVISKMLNRQYIGFEIVKEYYEFAKERLEKGLYRIKETNKTNETQPLLLFDKGKTRYGENDLTFLKTAKQIGKRLKRIPKLWNGRKSILEMKKANFPHWKQMEWIGFYFQFLCEKYLSKIMKIPGPKYGRVEFDSFKNIPWDFKAHAMNTSSHQIIVNDSEATAKGIKNYGKVGLILALGKVLYNDEDRIFQKWHEALKGGKSKYEIERIKRGAWSRLRKVSFDLQQISFIKITDDALVKCGSFQRDFRNAGEQPRKEKVLLDLEKIDEDLVYFVEFL